MFVKSSDLKHQPFGILFFFFWFKTKRKHKAKAIK